MDVYDILDMARVDMGGGSWASLDGFCGCARPAAVSGGDDLHAQIIAALEEVNDGR